MKQDTCDPALNAFAVAERFNLQITCEVGFG